MSFRATPTRTSFVRVGGPAVPMMGDLEVAFVGQSPADPRATVALTLRTDDGRSLLGAVS